MEELAPPSAITAPSSSAAMYDVFVIIAVSLVAALATEAASWYLIYRTPDYQRLKKSIETLQTKGRRPHAAPHPPASLVSSAR